MTFLVPAALGLALLAIPTIALFLVRPRAVRSEVGSLLLYRRVATEAAARASWRRLEDVLEAVLCVVAVLLIAGAAARPRAGDARRKVACVLDAGATMGARLDAGTRFDAALARARALADELAPEDELGFVLAGERARVLVALEPVEARPERVLDGLHVERGSSTREALALACALGASEVWLLSDGTGGATAPPAGVKLVYAPFGHADDASVSVAGVAARAVPGSPGEVEVVPLVASSARTTKTVRATLRLDGQPLVALEPRDVGPLSRTALGARRLPLPSGGALGLEVSSADDALATDDAATVTVPPARATRVLAPPGTPPFLRAALEADDAVELVARAEDADVAIVLTASAPAAGAPATSLPAFLVGPDSLASPGAEVVPGPVARLEPAHPVLAGVALDDLVLARAFRVDAAAPWRVLVRAGEDAPLVLARERDLARTTPRAVALAFDPEDSDLILRRAWPVLVSNAVHWLAGRELRESAPAVAPGGVTSIAARSSLGPGETLAPPPRRRARGLDEAWLALAALGLLAVESVLAWRRRRSAGPAERPRPVRRVLAATARALTLGLLAFAATSPFRAAPPAPPATAFVLDASASVGSRGLADGIATIASLARPGERVALVAAGDEPRLLPGAASLETTAPVASATDLASALALAEASLPAHGPGRIVLVTDGRETRGDVVAETARLRASGVPVSVVGIPREAPPDVRVARVDTDRAEVREGEPVPVRVTVEATRRARAHVTLARRGHEGWSRDVDLEPDAPVTLTFADRASERGVLVYEARATIADDREPANDRAGAALVVRGGPRALIVDAEGEGEVTARILAAQGFLVQRVAPRAIPSAEELAGFDLVVLASGSLLPGSAERQLDPARLADLERWVRDGGGLLALGGPESYGTGGWHGTELEDALPVTVEPPASGEKPSVALILAIDKSGSMNGPKLELAKLAAKNATWALSRRDRLGVIAFNFVAFWIVPLSPLEDRKAIQDQIEMQAAGGGTDLVPSLRAARAALATVDARVKHVLVLTDGISSNGDQAVDYARELVASERITTSTFAVGEDADQELLQKIAAAGHGRHHAVTRIGELPRVVLEETLVAARGAVEEEPFRARVRHPHPALARVDVEHAPPIHGLSAVRAKPLATVVLDGPRELPLLATWEHGLGRSAAWTSDLAPRWGDELVRWDGAPRLVGQLARWLARRDGSGGLAFELSADDRGARGVLLRVEARRADGSFANDLALEAALARAEETAVASLVPPGLGARLARERRVPLELTAPGRYEALVPGLAGGAWLVEARLGQARVGTAALWRGPSPEHVHVGQDRAALARIAAAGAGEPAPLRGSPRREPLALPLLAVAAVLVPVGLAPRRLSKMH